jgi:hypothetical protein
MIDRELYLPRSWTDDPARCTAAGIPDEVQFATKPALAGAMIARALEAGIPAWWVAADEVYGADPGLRADLQAREVGYVLAIGCDRRVPTAAGLAWRRWTLLAMLTHALLAVIAATEHAEHPPPGELITLRRSMSRRSFMTVSSR